MQENINTEEYWDAIYTAEGKETWRQYPQTFKLVETFAGGGHNIIELGCGPGILTNMLRRNNHVTGIDISCKACQMTGQPAFAHKIPPIPASYNEWDIVIATEFLEHTDNPEEIVKESRRVAKKAIFVVPNNTLGPEECKEHTIKFTRQSITTLFKKYYDDVTVIEYKERFDRIVIPCLLIVANSHRLTETARTKK